jgi:hypothetical protein
MEYLVIPSYNEMCEPYDMYVVTICYDWMDIECIVELSTHQYEVVSRHLEENLGCEGGCGGNNVHWCCYGNPCIGDVEAIDFTCRNSVNQCLFDDVYAKILRRDIEHDEDEDEGEGEGEGEEDGNEEA